MVGQPTRRSVDSQGQGRAIEPREYYPLEPSFLTARGQHRHTNRARGVRSGRGRRTRHRSTRVAWEPWETLIDSASISTGVGVARPQSSWPQAGVGPEWRDEHRRTGRYRRANDKEARREGRRESERLIVPLGAGEPVRRGPCRGKGTPRGGTVGGQQVGDFEPRGAVHVTPAGSRAHVSPRRDEPDA